MFYRSGSKKIVSILIIILLLSSVSVPVFADDPGSWSIKTSMYTIRYAHQVAVVNNKLYAIGGYNGASILSSVEEYNPETNTWTIKAPMANPRYGHEVAVINEKIYVVGGGYNAVEEYDPATNTWATKSSMVNSRFGFKAAVVNNKIYVIGGENGSGTALSSVEEYDPATNVWTTKASMPTARYNHELVVVDNKIYVVSGKVSSYTTTPAVEVYDPGINTWATKTPLSTSRDCFQIAAVNNKIYAMGGYYSNIEPSTGMILSSVEEYDIATDSWTTKSPMSDERLFHRLVVINNKIYSIGGYDNTNTFLLPVEEYNPATDTWSVKASMTFGRYYHCLAVIGNKVYVAGGRNLTSYNNILEEYTLPAETPSIPMNLSATAGDRKIDLSWNAVTDADSYIIKRATNTGGPYTTIAQNITGTAYSDTSVMSGTTYFYVVTAIIDSVESQNSNEASAVLSTAVTTGSAILVITLSGGTEKEYDLPMNEVNAFIEWYEGKANGTGQAYYIFDKSYNKGPFQSRKDYIVYDKILNFEIMQY
ncbi:MAG TPA: kelch repeat-containing protein [Clostridia bacterium]|nr:kelch repeat-containing protein [Clostridia bacterium]